MTTEGVELDTSSLVAAMRVYSGLVDRAASDSAYGTAVSVASRTRGLLPHRSGRLAASTAPNGPGTTRG